MSPAMYGLLLSFTLSAPYTSSEVQEIKDNMAWKEVSVMESVPRQSSLDWGGAIYHGIWLDPLHPHPRLSIEIRHSLDLWLRIVSSRIIFPHFGNKLLGRLSTDLFLDMFPTYDFNEVSTRDLEMAYSRTGLKTDGPCEMKQKWYPTNASPRTYFAQGSTAYHSSKYLRDAFNLLCDTIRPTARYTRVKPSLIRVDDMDEVLIYDLTSFTSLFHEQRGFLLFLAEYANSVEVVILDTYLGPIHTQLSSLILDYLVNCNIQPEYSTKLLGFDLSVRLCHSVAGFLGVYGNLATCTFPHGVFLASMKDSTEFSWCAGDDAGTSTSDISSVIRAVSTLGVIAEEKTFKGSEEGSVALKRPAILLSGHLFTLDNIIWPTFGSLFGEERFGDKDFHAEVIPSFLKSLIPFFRSCQSVTFSSHDLVISLEVLNSVYGVLGLPKEGYLPHVQGWHRYPCAVPVLDEYSFVKDPLDRLVELFYPGFYIGPLIGDSSDVPMLYRDVVFESVMTRELGLLCRLGYVVSKPLKCMYVDNTGLESLRASVRGLVRSSSMMYEFLVVEDPPEPLRVCPFSLST
jgi:hypothetical protein